MWKQKTNHKIIVGSALFVAIVFGLGVDYNPHASAADADFNDNIITVDSTGDGADASIGNGVCDDGLGNCTFRAAIEESNATAGAQTIEFAITGAADFTNNSQNGYTIKPQSQLPDITDTVIINGYSQPGAMANTAIAPNPLNGILLIELDGANQGFGGIHVSSGADNSTIRGLIVNRFTGNALRIVGVSNTKVQGCYVGVDSSGLIARPNGTDGVNSSTAIDIGDGMIQQSTDTSTVNTLFGGLNAQDRNIVSGNFGGGFGVSAVDSTFQGNYFGLGADGQTSLGNSAGSGVTTGVLTIDYADGVILGGSEPAAKNVISANGRGVQPDYSSGVIVRGELNRHRL